MRSRLSLTSSHPTPESLLHEAWKQQEIPLVIVAVRNDFRADTRNPATVQREARTVEDALFPGDAHRKSSFNGSSSDSGVRRELVCTCVEAHTAPEKRQVEPKQAMNALTVLRSTEMAASLRRKPCCKRDTVLGEARLHDIARSSIYQLSRRGILTVRRWVKSLNVLVQQRFNFRHTSRGETEVSVCSADALLVRR